MKKIIAGIFLVAAIASGMWFIGVKNTDAAIWSDAGKTYFSQSTGSFCNIGHCSVLPATVTPYCPSGYGDPPCSQSYSPTPKTSPISGVYPGWTCTTYSYNGKYWCSKYKYSQGDFYNPNINKDPAGYCAAHYDRGAYNKNNGTCYYSPASLVCASGSVGYDSHGTARCYQTKYLCEDGSAVARSSSLCYRYADTLYAYRSGAGDANYNIWGVIRSGDTLTKSQFFTGNNSGKPAALVQVLKDYYNGTHSNIAKVTNANAAYAKAGASFVVNTMLGRPQGSSRDVSSGDFDTLTSVLQYLDSKGLINWNASITGNSTNKNTHSVLSGGQFDIMQSNDDVTNRSGMTIKDGTGKIIYSLMYACANPYGDMEGIAPFDLYPSLTLSPDNLAESGSSVTINPVVNNKDKGLSYQTDWVVSRMILKNGAQPKAGSDSSTQTPAQYFPGSAQVGAGKGDFAQGINNIAAFTNDLPPTNPGDRVCFALSLTPFSTTASGWRHSNSVCIVIGKKPKVQVWGGDVRAGRAMSGVTASLGLANIMASTSVKSGNTYGSWAEYGVSATGSIIGFGSGSAFAATGGMPNANACSWSVLSLVNTPKGSNTCSTGGQIGSYSDNRVIPDVAASFGTVLGAPSIGGTVDVSSLAGINKASADIVISGGVVAKGHWVVIYAPNNNVRIAGNITYTNGPFSVLEDIPQLVIIARTIDIDAGVTQIDSWLFAKPLADGSAGIINTCREKGLTDALTTTDCASPLTVNGPVMASKLYLRRTAGSGSGPASGDPAERFNLRPDAYLWAYTRANTTLRANTVYVRELPPRL